MQSLGSDAMQQSTLRTLSTLHQVRVDDVIMEASADDQFDDEGDGSKGDDGADSQGIEDRTKPLSWSTERRDVTTVRSSIDKFDRLDFDSRSNFGYRLERPIGPRAANTFKHNSQWFPKDYIGGR